MYTHIKKLAFLESCIVDIYKIDTKHWVGIVFHTKRKKNSYE